MTDKKKINEIRGRNFALLREDRPELNTRKIAEMLGVTTVHLGGVKSGRRHFCHRMARKMEETFDLIPGWMDKPHDEITGSAPIYQTSKDTLRVFRCIHAVNEIRVAFEDGDAMERTKIFNKLYVLFDEVRGEISQKALLVILDLQQ